jgi:predicted N-formylglutamate amidohydrolase
MPEAVARLLAATDPDPVLLLNPGAASPLLLTADHAGRALPARLGDLGLPEDEIRRHIGWDIGIWGVTRRLSASLDAFAIGQAYSRLVIDCNRDPAWPTAIPRISESTEIPGNQRLTGQDRAAREREVFRPYHDHMAGELDRRAAAGMPTALIAMHSFTPAYKGVARPWHAGVLFHRHDRLATIMARLLRAEGGLVVGENEPYSVSDTSDYSVPVHAERRGLPYLELEIRQDLIADEAGEVEWAERLTRLLPAMWAAF